MVLFNRRIDVAPDDLYIPAFIITCFRLVWIPILSLSLSIIFTSGCDVITAFGYYAISQLILSVVGLVNAIIVWKISISGTIKNPIPQRKIGIVAHVETIITLFDYCLQLYGFYTTFNSNSINMSIQCLQNAFPIYIVRMVVIWAFVYDTLFFLIVAVLIYTSRSRKPSTISSYMQLWRKRIEWFISSPTSRTSESDEVISDLSRTLAHYFKETDWAPSDMAVGLLLLKREQKVIQRVTELRAFYKDQPYSSIYESFSEVPFENEKEQHFPFIEPETISDADVKGSPTIPEPCVSRSSLVKSHLLGRKSSHETLHNEFMLHNNLSRSSLASSQNSIPTRVNSILARKSEFQLRDKERYTYRNRSKSFSVHQMEMEEISVDKSSGQRASSDWSFASYAFNLNANGNRITRPDILDVIHFTHYANMAYVELDNDIQTKTDILIHFSPFNDLFRAPYLVSLDHDWNSIVIAIRGTYSAADLLVDLKIDSVMLDPDLSSPERYRVHSGFLLTALNIIQEIKSNHILDDIVSNPNSKTSNYHIVVCGHSLGAAVGCLVAYFLRKEGYSGARCYGYSMPGSVVNDLAASLFNDFCISVVAGDDLISRVGTFSMDILKKDIKRNLENCDLPKYQVFGSAIGNYFLNRKETRKTLLQRTQNGTIPDNTNLALHPNEIERIRLATFSIPRQWRIGNRAHLQHTQKSEVFKPMFIPGRILYLEKIRDHVNVFDSKESVADTNRKRKRGQYSLQRFTDAVSERIKTLQHQSIDYKYAYAPRWADKEEFQEIMVSRSMIRDHVIVFGIMKEFETFEESVPLRALS
jgi:hypothetical protein